MKGSACTMDGDEQCAACNDGYTTGLSVPGGVCYLERSHCDDVPVRPDAAACFYQLGHVYGATSKDISLTWARTDTSTWEECQSLGASVELCAEASGEAGVPLVTQGTVSASGCAGTDYTSTICGGGDHSSETSHTYEYELDGILGHHTLICAEGLHLQVQGREKAFSSFARSEFTVQCVRRRNESAVCPGTLCQGADVFNVVESSAQSIPRSQTLVISMAFAAGAGMS